MTCDRRHIQSYSCDALEVDNKEVIRELRMEMLVIGVEFQSHEQTGRTRHYLEQLCQSD
jgi:hypothetical protein